MDDSGNVALVNPTGGPNFPTYYTFHYGVPTAIDTPVTPTFTDDQGTVCTPAVPPGGFVIFGICNNGREAFTGTIASAQSLPGLYSGSSPNITAIEPAGFGDGLLYMNSNGDIVADDAFTGDWYFFQDTSTVIPEPSGIILFGTGALALLEGIRRRAICKA